jgi:PAS domain S-box-containing protein
VEHRPVLEFFSRLFDTRGFSAHGSGDSTSNALVWLPIVSDALICAACITIALLLLSARPRRTETLVAPLLRWLIALVLLVGLSHLVDASLAWQPWYRLAGLVKAVTAVIAWGVIVAWIRKSRSVTVAAEQRLTVEPFRDVIEAAPNAIVMVNAHGEIVLANSQAETLFGYTRDEMFGQMVELLIPDRYWDELPELRAKYFRNPHQIALGMDRDLVGLRRDGNEFPIVVGLNPIHTAAGVLVISSIVDVSERKQAEDTMRTVRKTLEQEVAQRTRLITLQHDIAAICNQAESVDRAMRSTMRRICEHLEWPVAHAFVRNKLSGEFECSRIWISFGDPPQHMENLIHETREMFFLPGQSWLGQVVVKRLPQWAGDIEQVGSIRRYESLKECGIRSILAFPVLVDDDVEAVIEFFSDATTQPTYELLSIMQEVGRLLGWVIERFELQRAIAESVEIEQRRIAEELHDGLGQELTAMSLMAKSLHRALELQNSPVADRAKDLAESIPRIVRQTRAVVRGLMPVEVDAAALMSALEQLADSTQRLHGVTCRLDAPVPVQVENNVVAHHLYRIAQEALNNALKHSGAEQLTIRLRQTDQEIVLEVADDGHGIDGSSNSDDEPLSRGMGLRIMKHRANLIGGTLAVLSTATAGTTVLCRLKTEEVKHEW